MERTSRTSAQSPSAPRDPRSDAQLLAAIAQSRDHNAFDEFIRRFERRAFSVASHIIGRRDAAEEVVQDAMMRVWSSAAASYRGEGEVRSWLLRIVARESIHQLRNKKRTPVNMDPSYCAESPDSSPQSEAESSELMTALRREFNRLPELERQLVGLRFAGGLTQDEISSALSIPQQTVSYRINEVLKRLRANLAAAGFAAAVPLVTAEGLGEVLSTGTETPPGLHSQILQQCRQPRSRSIRRTSQATSRTWLVAAASLTAIVVGGGLWLAFSTSTSAGKMPEPQAQAAPAPVESPPAANAEVDWHHTWNFENAPPADLQMDDHFTHWNRATKTLDIAEHGYLCPTYPLPKYPLLFTAKCRLLNSQREFGASAVVVDDNDQGRRADREWRKQFHSETIENVAGFYIYDKFLIALFNDRCVAIGEFKTGFYGKRLLLGFANLSISELSVRPVGDSELPDFVRHPELIEKEMKLVDPAADKPK